MKTIFTKSFLFALALSCANAGFSQTKLPPGQAAKFGIDGDVRSDQADQGGFVATGSHDWFKKSNGTGNGLFDTTGAAHHSAEISSGKNHAFTKKMQYPRYSIQDGILLLDASYSRDYYGIGPAEALNDKTVFVSTVRESNKNFQDPSTWTTIPNGGTIPNKTDIIDSYVNMRRNGTVLSGNKVSDLVLTVGATSLSTDGDKYMDFEFYKERINYNPITGKFENPAPSSTGGHSPWIINQQGDIEKFGDMTISFTFNSTGVADIMLFIWTDYKTYQRASTNRFDFVQNSWSGAGTKSGYGYAQIMPNGNYSVKAWGTVNTHTTAGPLWGTSSKDLGSQSGNYNADGYSAGQFAEAGINLTAFGIDPATALQGMEACNPPFTRFMVKTRSSSSFSSSLQDFTGPYEFLDAPTVPADLNEPATLTCKTSSVYITPTNYLSGAHYSWSTPDGNISQTASGGSSILVSKPGTYYLTAAVVDGCQTTSDSVVVYEDKFKPKATASSSVNMLVPGQSAILLGGDPLQSNYLTQFGGSKGLVWKWTKQEDATFISNVQNPVITMPGNYVLTVTETRNGCTDVAYTAVGFASTLAVKFTDFSVNSDRAKKVNNLAWKVADATTVEQFVAEKSANGIDFTAAGYAFADNNFLAYSLKDNAAAGTAYYRIKAISKGGAVSYSSVIKSEGNSASASFRAFADAAGLITLSYVATGAETVTIRIINMNGQVVKSVQRNVASGSNTIQLSEVTKPASGLYVVTLESPGTQASAKIKW